jgi:hypothetical protein
MGTGNVIAEMALGTYYKKMSKHYFPSTAAWIHSISQILYKYIAYLNRTFVEII